MVCRQGHTSFVIVKDCSGLWMTSGFGHNLSCLILSLRTCALHKVEKKGHVLSLVFKAYRMSLWWRGVFVLEPVLIY